MSKNRPQTRELPASVRRMQGIRSSGAHGTHADRRTRRLRTRSAVRRSVLVEQRG